MTEKLGWFQWHNLDCAPKDDDVLYRVTVWVLIAGGHHAPLWVTWRRDLTGETPYIIEVYTAIAGLAALSCGPLMVMLATMATGSMSEGIVSPEAFCEMLLSAGFEGERLESKPPQLIGTLPS